MINNICENNKSAEANTAFKTTITTAANVDNRHNRKANFVAAVNDRNSISSGSVMQTTYGNGIWYSKITDSGNNTHNNALVHKQQYYNNAIGNNNKENDVNKNVWLSTISSDDPNEQKQQSHSTHTNNKCDIIIVDIENEDDYADANDEGERQGQQHYHQQKLTYNIPTKFFRNENIKFPQKHPTICDSERARETNNISCSNNSNTQYIANDAHVNVFQIVDSNNDNEANEEDEDESLDSMETLSDNVSIWIGVEKHWVAGVDANTTCSELIWALLNYQNGQHSSQHAFDVATTIPSTTNKENIVKTVIKKTNSNQYEKRELQEKQQQQQQQKEYDNNVIEFNLSMSTNDGSSNICTGNKPNIQNTANTNNSHNEANTTNTTTTSTTTTSTSAITTSINQSMPINTKENCKIIQNSTLAVAEKLPIASSLSSDTPIISSLAPVSEMTPSLTLLPLTLPTGIATVSQLATEYVIVKQYHQCEEYLDGSTKVFDVLPPRNGSNKKECELMLRHLGPVPAAYMNNTTPQLSSLISTDKDSGMGSPVGSARSAKFRRRKHKSSQWLAQANTLHPKLSRCSANERLLKIILSQDETIQQQLSLLREKERQITKIEEEKHRKRERELGKNYLLETYLNGLDEAECEPEIRDSEEIFIDEPNQRAAATAILTTNFRTAGTTSTAALAAGAITDNIPSLAEALNTKAKHKLKEKNVKKEKKKKRHKEKQTKDEEIQGKKSNLKMNKNKDKEKVDTQQQHHREFNCIDRINIRDNSNEQEIEMQISWLEKIYTLNKQLQKEEELATKLHAKVRKHQLRKTQETQQEAQMEIDKLDNNLALQCSDIRKVEANLMQTNEQLQKKLFLLERLSIEYLEEQREKHSHDKHDDVRPNIDKQAVKAYLTKETENPLTNDANTLLINLEKSLDLQNLSLNNIKSKEEVIKLEKIIAKPNKNLRPEYAELNESEQNLNIMTQDVTNSSVRAKSNFFPTNQRFSNITPVSTNRCLITTMADKKQLQQQQQYHLPQQELITTSTAAIPVIGETLHSDETSSNDTMSTSCMFVDKNMLSSLHVQNAKTIKKQMFHTQTIMTAAAASDSTTSSHLLPPTQPTSTSTAFPNWQFQQSIQQYMPKASTFLTSRPQNSQQLQPENIFLVQQPSTPLSSCSSHLTKATSSPAAASVQTAQHPPNSTSPSPSIMAMNTVDISQLGTLV